jgi:hypothetical protein
MSQIHYCDFYAQREIYFEGVYGLVVFNTTYNNISVTPWQSVLLVEEAGVNPETTIIEPIQADFF